MTFINGPLHILMNIFVVQFIAVKIFNVTTMFKCRHFL